MAMRGWRWWALAGATAAWCYTGSEAGMAAPRRVVTLTSLCLLDGKEYASRDYVLRETRAACTRGKPDLVVTPFLPFLSFREGREGVELAPFAALAREHRTYLAVAMPETRQHGSRSHTAVLFDRSGRVVGRYRQTHAFPDDDGIVLGEDLPVFHTDFAVVGLSVGSDFYFPEVYWVQR
ncbi:MAG: carbon-nitrogen hydrolase family protein, partial [Armatimonadota bacterium]|nr:carbon-nitrogen hydrolase family protein [Armatimonadota bacterium]